MPEFLQARRAARGFTPELIAHARQRYEETEETQASIAADMGVHSKTLRTLAQKQGWIMRRDRPPRDVPSAIRLHQEATQAVGAATDVASSACARAPDAEDDTALSVSLALRLELAVEKEIRKVEALRNEFGNPAHRSIEAERTARTLATLTETLFKVRRLREVGSAPLGTDHDDLPADIDGFRDALARRIDAFVAGRADAGLAATDDTSGAAPPAA